MLKALGSQLQRQQGCPTSLLPYFQVAGFAKKKGKDDDSGPDPKSNRLLKARSPAYLLHHASFQTSTWSDSLLVAASMS